MGSKYRLWPIIVGIIAVIGLLIACFNYDKIYDSFFGENDIEYGRKSGNPSDYDLDLSPVERTTEYVDPNPGGDNPEPGPTPEPVPEPTPIYISSIELSGCNNLIVGNSETITASILPTNAEDKSLIWSTSNASVATVSDGTVTAKAAGTVRITAYNATSNVQGACTISVSKSSEQPPAPQPVYVSSIVLSGCNNLTVGGSENITASINPGNANDKSLTWSTSNSSIATVSNGRVTAKAAGTVKITAFNNASGVQGACSITVNKAPDPTPTPIYVSSISLSGCNNLTVGGSESITATINPSNANDKSLIWSTSNSSIATVSNGRVTAIGAGTVTITATNNASGKRGTCSIKVEKVPDPQPSPIYVSSISLSGCNKLTVGGSETITATINPSNANDKSLTWSTSNSSVATVSNGKVTAKGAGTATITATNNASGKQGTCSIKVEKVPDPTPNIYNKVEYYFLSTNSDTYNHSEAVIMKTSGGKYVLLDTAVNDTTIANVIINKLKSLQGVSKPVIDYLILSHSHDDHAGGLYKLKGKVTVKNYIAKSNKHGTNGNSLVASTVGGTRKNITSEGEEVVIDDDLTLKFYNVSDVYANVTSCVDNYQLWLRAPKPDGSTNSDAQLISVNGVNKYIYISGKEFRNGTYKYHVTDNVVQIQNASDNFDLNFYFSIKRDKYPTCNDNANSYAILAKVNNGGSNDKYAYFPSDIENVGYSIFPDSNGIAGGAYTETFSSIPTFTTNNTSQGGKFNNVSNKVNKVPSETNAAKKVKSYLGNNLNKLVIYQAAHHGYNTTSDVANMLGLFTRSNVYSITSLGTNPNNSKNFSIARSYWYTLRNTKRFNTGKYTAQNGIYCYIKSNGDYGCNSY